MPDITLADAACDPQRSRGRRHVEPACTNGRTEYQRDRDRIVISQFGVSSAGLQDASVFLNHEGDLFRTRLTHSLEVAQLGPLHRALVATQ
jgi:dGTPase